MLSYGLQNVRSIERTPEIDLLPLTLVVGRNSVGKSSLIRWLPLIAQSESADSGAPIAWRRRHQSLVDFGSFEETVRRGAEPREIQFFWTSVFGELGINHRVRVHITLASESPGSATFVRSCSIVLGDVIFDFRTSGSENEITVEVNGAVVGRDLPALPEPARYVGLLPSVTPPMVNGPLVDLLDRVKYRRADMWRLQRMATALQGWTPRAVFTIARRHPDLTPAWRDNFPRFEERTDVWQQMLRLVALRQAPRLLTAVRRDLQGALANLVYVAPFRSEPARSERSPEPSARLDARGESLLSFLEGLRPSDRTALSGWIRDALGFSIELRKEGMSSELRVIDRNGLEANIADVGFGVGQILPVLLHLWALIRDPAEPAAIRPVVIEQPELHLHPAMQARVGRLLSGVARDSGPAGARLLVETHSEAIVSAVGKAIADGVLTANDVQVLMFEQQPGGPATVRVVRYDPQGYLDAASWPYEFFSA